MKKSKLHLLLLSLTIIAAVPDARSQKIDPTWESIQQRPYPQWFSDAKLGIFIHWGLYSVPAYSGKEQYAEWYYRGLMGGDRQRLNFQHRVYGGNSQYEDFKNLFKGELFDAEEWAKLFKDAGAKYVILVSKHHDGYCLWNSKYKPDFNSVTSGPHRDIVGEVADAVRNHGMKMGLYYSLPEWRNNLHRWYVDSPDSIAPYVENYMIPQFKELVSTYRPSLIFSDGEWLNTAEQWHAAELISWYYNLVGDEAIVNDRWGHGSNYGYRTPEYSAGITITDRPWAECRGLGRSFGLNRNEPLSNYMTSEELVRHFVKLVAAGGGMTLNVGPAADGKIPMLQQDRLIELGNWLKINGEAIYETRPYSHFYEEKPYSITRIDSNINFNWVRNAPDKEITYDHFEINWEGYLTPPQTGKYYIEADVDDFIALYIGDQLLFSNMDDNERKGEHGKENTINFHNEITLQANKEYPIKIRFKEEDLEAKIVLKWSYNGTDTTVIPAEYFSYNGIKKQIKGTYTCQKPYIAYTTKNNKLYAIALEYPDNELKLNIPQPDKNAKVTLLGREGELPWNYNNGVMIIDTKGIKFSEIKSKYAWTFTIE